MNAANRMMATGLLVGCIEKKDSNTRPKRTDIVVYDTPEGLSRMINPPTPVTNAHWALVPVVPQTRGGLGPTDENFYAVLALDSTQWPAWERTMTASASQGEYYLMEEVAEKLLPSEWLSYSVSDSLKGSRRLTGTFYDLDSMYTGWGRNGLAIRHGKYLFLDFYLN